MDFDIPADIQELLDQPRPVHRGRDQAARARERQHSLLRSSSRGQSHRLGSRRLAQRRVGGPAQGDAATRRCGRLPALPPARALRRPGRFQPRPWRSSVSTWPPRDSGLHNDLQNESSIVGNFPTVLMMEKYGSQEQQDEWIPKMLASEARIGFGLTEPMAGTDATRMQTTAYQGRRRVGHQRRQAVEHRNARCHARLHLLPHVGQPRRAKRHHQLHRAGQHHRASPSSSCGGPTTCRPTTPRSRSTTCGWRESHDPRTGGATGLRWPRLFVHENRIRQAASSRWARPSTASTSR